jgi:predicted nuclease of predicted toxin-antitoxin system
MMKLYSNENFPFEVVKILRSEGFDVLTTMDAGKAGNRIPDEEVLEFAINQGRAVITLNRKDFKRLHYLRPNHSGIILCTENRNFASMASEIIRVISLNDDIAGQLLKVYRPKL